MGVYGCFLLYYQFSNSYQTVIKFDFPDSKIMEQLLLTFAHLNFCHAVC